MTAGSMGRRHPACSADADASPIFGLTSRSERRSQLELSAFADTIKERLQTVPGIASVFPPAEKRYAMRLWMEPDKLAAYGLTPLDVRTALQRENVELPSRCREQTHGGAARFDEPRGRSVERRGRAREVGRPINDE